MKKRLAPRPGGSVKRWYDHIDFTRQLSQYLIVGYAIHRYLIICDHQRSIKFLRSLPLVVVFVVSSTVFRILSPDLIMWLTMIVFDDRFLTLGIVHFLVDQPIFLILTILHVSTVHKMNHELNTSISFLRGMVYNDEIQARIADKERFKLLNSLTLALQLTEWIVKMVFDLIHNMPYICVRFGFVKFCVDYELNGYQFLRLYTIFNGFTESICILTFSIFHLILMPSYHRALTTFTFKR